MNNNSKTCILNTNNKEVQRISQQINKSLKRHGKTTQYCILHYILHTMFIWFGKFGTFCADLVIKYARFGSEHWKPVGNPAGRCCICISHLWVCQSLTVTVWESDSAACFGAMSYCHVMCPGSTSKLLGVNNNNRNLYSNTCPQKSKWLDILKYSTLFRGGGGADQARVYCCLIYVIL